MKRITAWLLAALMLVAVFPMAVLADGESGMDPAGTKYTVTFDKNGGNGEMAAVEVDAGAEYTLPACAFDAPEGKAFDKWDKGAVGAKITVNENTIVKAEWKDAPAPEPVKYTVTFDTNGGNGEMAAVEVDAGAEYTLPACAFDAPEGKAFDKWDKGAVGAKITVNENTTVKAEWKDKPAPAPKLVVSDSVFDYDGNEHSATAAKVENGEGYEIEYSTDNGTSWSKNVPKIKDAGEVKVQVRALKSGAETLTASFTLKVNALAKTPKLTAKGGTFTYDGKAHKVEAALENADGYTIEYSVDGGKTWTKDAPSLTNAGKVTVKVRATKSGAETLTCDDVTLEVTGKTVKSVKIINCKNAVNVREKASSSSKKLGLAKKGATYELLGKEGKWYKVQYTKDKVGYIWHEYIEEGTTTVGGDDASQSGTSSGTTTTGSYVKIVNCNTRVNVRKKASSSSTKLGTADKGTTYKYLGKEGNWYKIQYTDKTEGYVYSRYVELTGTSSGSTAGGDSSTGGSTTTPTGKIVTIVNCSTSCNVRKEGKQASKKIGNAPVGKKYTYLGLVGVYYKIQYTDKTVGYVHKNYAKISDGTAKTDTEGDKTSTGKTGTIVNVKVACNIRKGPSTSTKLLGTMKKGAKVTILGTSGSYTKIKYNGGEAYIYSKYVKAN